MNRFEWWQFVLGLVSFVAGWFTPSPVKRKDGDG